jgi:hypothetical protein
MSNATYEPQAGQAVWWRLPIVWLVIGGPAVVVVASFATLALAILNPDPVILATPSDRAAVPAIQARNHAASPQR